MWIPMPSQAATAALRFGNGGQITISARSGSATIERNFSKNAAVSGHVLYIFQLPAITGFLIRFAAKNWSPSRFQHQNSQLRFVRYRRVMPARRDLRRAG